MTCQAQDSEGVFNKPWVWAILGVFLLFGMDICLFSCYCCHCDDKILLEICAEQRKQRTQ